mmetsp:Transcript_14808/g.28676  ORF Transcript_14808/g.28676 Transcript_14808/m.28676 type:complete len:1164 (+) Transcript_14808:302-3793(+)
MGSKEAVSTARDADQSAPSAAENVNNDAVNNIVSIAMKASKGEGDRNDSEGLTVVGLDSHEAREKNCEQDCKDLGNEGDDAENKMSTESKTEVMLVVELKTTSKHCDKGDGGQGLKGPVEDKDKQGEYEDVDKMEEGDDDDDDEDDNNDGDEDVAALAKDACENLGLGSMARSRAAKILTRVAEEEGAGLQQIHAWSAAAVFVAALEEASGKHVENDLKNEATLTVNDESVAKDSASERTNARKKQRISHSGSRRVLPRMSRRIGLGDVLGYFKEVDFDAAFLNKVYISMRLLGGSEAAHVGSFEGLDESLRAHKQLEYLYEKFVGLCDEQDPLYAGHRKLAWYLFLVGRRMLLQDQGMEIASSYQLLVDAVEYVRHGHSSEQIQCLKTQLTEVNINSADVVDIGRYYEDNYLQDLISLDERSFLKTQDVPFTPAQTPLKERRGYGNTGSAMYSTDHTDVDEGANPAEDDDNDAVQSAYSQNMPPPLQPRTRCKRRADEMAMVRTLPASTSLSDGEASESSARGLFQNAAPEAASAMPPLHPGLPRSGGATSPRNASRRVNKLPRPAETPVSLAVETQNWLHRELLGASEGPEPTLLRFLAECEEAHAHQFHKHDIQMTPQDDSENEQSLAGSSGPAVGCLAADIEARLREMRAALLEDSAEDGPQAHITKELFHGNASNDASNAMAACSSSSSVAAIKKHTSEGAKLYYRVLESILQGEATRLSSSSGSTNASGCGGDFSNSKGNLWNLLTSDMFHRGLFACCMEVIFRAKEIFRLMHPTLTDRLKLPGLELLKVLESFMKYVPMLPKMLVQRMHMLETDILEEHVWRKGSPIFELLKERKRVVEVEHKDAKTVPKLRALDNFFTQKLLAHAHEKAKKIYLRLGFPQDEKRGFYSSIWLVFRATIKHHPTLCQDRHLDTIILCCIFAVSKLRAEEPVTFKRLVAVYKESRVETADTYAALISNMSRPRTPNLARTDKVVERIYMPNNANKRITRSGAYNNTGTIVDFYNQFFLRQMKPTILNLRVQPSSSSLHLQSPAIGGVMVNQPISPTNNAASSARFSSFESPERSSHSIYASPAPNMIARHAGVVAPEEMTPQMLRLYAQAEPEANDVQLVNGNSRRSRLHRNPMEDDDDEPSAHPPTRRLLGTRLKRAAAARRRSPL